MTSLIGLLPDRAVEFLYVRAGGVFGGVNSELLYGECPGFWRIWDQWAKLEEEYVDRGYRPLSLHTLDEHHGYGKPIDELLGQKLDEGEKPVLHAQEYKKQHDKMIEHYARRDAVHDYLRPL
jgi:hypothetical protein